MSKNQRKRTSAPVLALGAPDTEKAAERTKTQLTDAPAAPASPADIIRDEYGIESNSTNVPQILRAILCEMVRRRV